MQRQAGLSIVNATHPYPIVVRIQYLYRKTEVISVIEQFHRLCYLLINVHVTKGQMQFVSWGQIHSSQVIIVDLMYAQHPIGV